MHLFSESDGDLAQALQSSQKVCHKLHFTFSGDLLYVATLVLTSKAVEVI